MNKYAIGSIIKCQVTGIEKYGIFVNVDNKYTGLIHISEISEGFVRNIDDYVSSGDNIYCKIIEIDEDENKLKLSIKGLDYRHNKNHSDIIENEKGFEPLKKELPYWIDEKLKQIKEQS